MKNRWRDKTRVVALVLALALVASFAVVIGHRLGRGAVPATLAVGAVPTVLIPPTTTTTEPPPTTTTIASTTSAPAPQASTAAKSKARPLARAPILAGSIGAFRGLGSWVDVYDWSNEYTKTSASPQGNPTVGVAGVDRMADLGVQTLYIQAAKDDSANDIVDPQLLHPMIDRAHARGMAVVSWYLPTLEDPTKDLTRLLAISRLKVEGIGVDIESRKVDDAAERTRRLINLSAALRQQLPGRAIAAIVMPPVATEVINPAFWPGFPWHELRPLYDVWMPMDYWTFRKADSGYREGYRYTAENIDRLRADLGVPNAPIHPIGGLAESTTAADAEGYYKAAAERGVIGGGLYDYRTTADDLWAGLRRFRV